MRKPTVLFAVAALLLSATSRARGADESAPAKIKVLIVTGFDVESHKWEESTRLNAAILEQCGRFNVSIANDKEKFAALSPGDFDAVVLGYGFWNEPDPSDKAKEGLLDYVKNGGNVVALHFACSAFQDWDEYASLLGRVWKKGVGGHGPYGEFTVNIKDKDHPITRGIDDFKTEDELYAKLTGDEEIEVLATAYSDWSEKVEPLVFVKRYGEGRVVQDLLGHGLDAKQNTSYQKLLCRVVEWAATGDVAGE